MSPDLEWHVGEESDRETIVKTTPRKPPRWRWPMIAFVVMLGASLGALYRSIPESPEPTPSPTSTPLPPPPIGTVIEQEARALATGDRAAFLALQDQNDGEWYRAQQAAFKTWGTPPSNAALYTIVESGTLSNGQVWVDLYQWRDVDRYFRETRFYRLRDNRWQRVRPSLSFWSGLELTAGRTPSSTPPYAPPYASYIPFSLVYPKEDNSITWYAVQRMAAIYQLLCRDLECDAHSRSDVPIALIFKPDADRMLVESSERVTITLRSPRLTGIYYPVGGKDDPITQAAYQSLLLPVVRTATGNPARWANSTAGDLFIQGIAAWEQLRINARQQTPPEVLIVDGPGALSTEPSQGDPAQTQQFYTDLLADQKLLPLASLWQWPPRFALASDVADGEVDALIAFIEQRYGAIGVVKFLNAIGPANSLQAAIETGLGVKYKELEQAWLKWIGRRA